MTTRAIQRANVHPLRNANANPNVVVETKLCPCLRPLIYKKDWTAVIELLKKQPAEASCSDRVGDLPIHEACAHGAPFQVIRVLISANPDGVKAKGFCGRLPLHYAVYNKPSLHVIKVLLSHYPAGASIKDEDWRLPLHLAVVRNAPKDAIQALINIYPKGLKTPNKFGSTPVLLAQNDHIFKMLLEEEKKPRFVQRQLLLEAKMNAMWNGDAKGLVEKNNNKAIVNKGASRQQQNALSKYTTVPAGRIVGMGSDTLKKSKSPQRKKTNNKSKNSTVMTPLEAKMHTMWKGDTRGLVQKNENFNKSRGKSKSLPSINQSSNTTIENKTNNNKKSHTSTGISRAMRLNKHGQQKSRIDEYKELRQNIGGSKRPTMQKAMSEERRGTTRHGPPSRSSTRSLSTSISRSTSGSKARTLVEPLVDRPLDLPALTGQFQSGNRLS
eukprot:CAMPEP_0184867328 /NCGR_PEP_ID=MMETSP0580-20130426/26067_1 /TAXON_ID=1118495 /ORGANISM="Dactyliosolen fragilissimus" /LENGTH=439 /DNA_ID=CAMNT_0027367545 /DNA_START=143 /DNA_END=1463 /DNA_ORIENTATION=-